MDKRKGILNIGTSIVSRIILLLAALYVRRLLILYIGNEANGLNSLFASLIGVLSVAELGAGSAIVFSMYKPIIEGDDQTVAALYRLYRRMYRIIGAVILAAGLGVMPFLPHLISDYESIPFNIYIPYLLTLSSAVLSYLYSYKTSLIQAYKENYIVTEIVTMAGLIRSGLQIAAILVFKSYIAYLICSIIETAIVWYFTDQMVRKMHPEITGLDIGDYELGEDIRDEVSANIKAMFMHKIGSVMVSAVDSLVISAFIGVVILGKYSNYIAIRNALSGSIALFFTPLTSVIGHMCAAESKENIRKYYDFFYSFNYVLGVVFFLGYYAIIDDLIAIIFGTGLGLSRMVTFVITLEAFIGYMRNAPLLFRDASGAFYYDRWKPFFEGIINLALSIALIKILPEEWSVAGVVAATILTQLLICDIVEPHVIFRYVFGCPVKSYYIKNYVYIAAFAGSLVIMEQLRVSCESVITELVINGCISVVISMAALAIIGVVDKSFRNEAVRMLRQMKHWIRQKRVDHVQ